MVQKSSEEKIDKLTKSSSRVQAIPFSNCSPGKGRESRGLKFSPERSATGCHEMDQHCGGVAKLHTVSFDFV